MFKDFAFVANGFVLLGILVFSLVLVLYKSPEDRSGLYKRDAMRIVYGLSEEGSDNAVMIDEVYRKLLSDSLKILSYTPYDRQGWVFFAALVESNKALNTYAENAFDPLEKAKAIAKSLQSNAAKQVDAEVEAMARALNYSKNSHEDSGAE